MTLGHDSFSRPFENARAEAALGRVLHALAQMPGLAQVAEATLAACQSVTGASEVYVLFRQGDVLRLQAAIGLPPPEAPVDLPVDESIEGQAALTGQTVQCVQPASDPAYRPLPGRQELPGVLTALPLQLRGSVTGVLACARGQAAPFTEGELRWLRHFADMLAVAAENARLLGGERRNRAQAEILSRVSAVEGSDIGDYSQRMAEALVEALGVQHAAVLLHNRREHALTVLGWAADGSAPARQTRLPLSDGGVLGEALQRNELWVLQGGATVRELGEVFEIAEPGSALAIPLPAPDGPRGLLLLLGEAGLTIGEQDTVFLRLVAERVALTLHRTEMELEHARSQARQEFLSVVSHELRTPLAVIKAYTEVLARRAEGGSASGDDARVLANVSEQVELMQGMVEHLLDLQRLDGGQLPLELSRFDLGALAGRAVEALQATTSQHQLVLEAQDSLLVTADRRRIHEVISNLIENAIKYSPDGGQVTVRVRCSSSEPDQGSAALVTVTDQGIGISPDDLPRIFDRFYQGNLPPYRGRRGMGLGLAIAREIITRHGGQMWVQSELGRGSTFSISLPLAGPEAEA